MENIWTAHRVVVPHEPIAASVFQFSLQTFGPKAITLK